MRNGGKIWRRNRWKHPKQAEGKYSHFSKEEHEWFEMNSNDTKGPLLVTFSSEGRGNRGLLSKALVSSLLRCLFSGTQRVIRNFEMPIFKIERRQVNEVLVNVTVPEGAKGEDLAFLFSIPDDVNPDSLTWMYVADAAGMALRNIDHLIPLNSRESHGPQEVDLYWTRMPGDNENGKSSGDLASPGLWAVRGEHLSLVLNRWNKHWDKEHETKSDEQVWTEVVRNLPLRTRAFEKGEVYAPRIGAVDWEAVTNAAFVTVPDWPEKEQWKFLQALYFGTYFGDETGLMLNILDP